MSKNKTGHKSMQLSIPPQLHRKFLYAANAVNRPMKRLAMEFIDEGVARLLVNTSEEEIDRFVNGIREAYDVKGADMSAEDARPDGQR